MKHKNHDAIIAYSEGKRIRNISTHRKFQLTDIGCGKPDIFDICNQYEVITDVGPLARLNPRQGHTVTMANGSIYIVHSPSFNTVNFINAKWGTSLNGEQPLTKTYDDTQKELPFSKITKITDPYGGILFERDK